ncbi:Endonuclease/exonuclease/phosphatase [Corchorus olitorius]|uniref:Endonuclease/exonuclease/phosphatase n=1 Tax=Corchorus olitorius TaxID=93759 RepID=A0A1R3G235_9ROSI|nr:Endonuclease/exonuclease/phosphatase [Corchorus olitorius]
MKIEETLKEKRLKQQSGDSAQNEYINNPPPPQEIRRRRSHGFSFSSEVLEERKNEGYECLVGFLLDDLPFEYQQPLVARRMSLSVGEVLQTYWENMRLRNIRFMRVRICVDLSVPLTPGCTLERDDGTSQWEGIGGSRETLPKSSNQDPTLQNQRSQNEESQTQAVDVEEHHKKEIPYEHQPMESQTPPLQLQGEEGHVEAIRELQVELSHLTRRHTNQPNPLINGAQESDHYPLNLIEDLVREFDNSIERVQRIYARHEGGFQNQADYDDMMFALAREQSRFEHICQEINAENLKAVGNSLYNFQLQDFTNNLCIIPEGEGGKEENETQARDIRTIPLSSKRIRQRLQSLVVDEEGLVRGSNQSQFNPYLVFLMETKDSIDWARKHTRSWGFSNYVGTNASGHSGGILLLWKDSVNVTTFINENIILLYLESGEIRSWVTSLYGNPDLKYIKEVWNLLLELKHNVPENKEWVILGDFNQVLKSDDKPSDTSTQIKGANELQLCLDQCKMAEIANKGLHFTWSNRREEGQCRWERLDRAFANANWFQKFENAVLTNLPITVSDHSPLLLLQLNKADSFRKRPYRFEMMWSRNEHCEEVIRRSWNQQVTGSAAFRLVQKINITREDLKHWNKTVFGNLYERKKALERELEEIQTNIGRPECRNSEAGKRKEMEEILEQEQILWMQKSRAN